MSSRQQVVYGNQNWNTTVTGTTPNYFDIRTWPVQAGSVFSDEEVDIAANVCVIGTTVEKILFLDENPIGKTIRIGNLPFRVDGVLESKGQNVIGQDQDDVIFAPYTTVQRKIAGHHLAAVHQRVGHFPRGVRGGGRSHYQLVARAAPPPCR